MSDADDNQMADDDHDRAALIAAPALVMAMVAGADGTIDKRERATARDFMERYADSGKSHTVSDLMRECLQHFDRHLDEAINDDREHRLANLREACEWHLHGRARMAFVKVLMELGQHIAEASGGFLGFGDKVCQAEREALERLRKALI